MRLVDKLFGRSRILTLGKLHYQSHDGEPVTISKDLRYTIRCGNSTLHMYEWQDVVVRLHLKGKLKFLRIQDYLFGMLMFVMVNLFFAR